MFREIGEDTKLCTKCLQWKDKSLFPHVKVKRKTGTFEIIQSHCLKCKRVTSREWREKKRAEGTLKEYQLKSAKRYKERHKEKIRRLKREYSHRKRRMEGAKERLARREYSYESYEKMRRLPAGPITEYLQEKNESFNTISTIAGISHELASRLARGKKPTVSEEVVDKILTGYGEPWLLTELYPELEIGA